MLVLVILEISGNFVNILTADEKYYFRNSGILGQPIQLQLSKKQMTCSQFLPHIWNLQQFLNILQKKKSPIAYMFEKLRNAKHVLR